MTVPIDLVKEFANGNGITTIFFFTFRLIQDLDMTVYVDKVLVSPSTYTVTINPNGIGGQVVFTVAPQVGITNVLLYRFVDYLQETHFPNESDFNQVSLEDTVDKLAMGEQQLEEIASRAVLWNKTVPNVPDLELPVPEASKAIGWNLTEDGLVNLTINGTVTGITGPTGATGPPASSSPTNFPSQMQGNRVTWVDADTVQIGIGTTSGAMSFAIMEVTAPINILLSASGVNGLQTGSVETFNTWYKLFLIGDSSTTLPTAGMFVPYGTALVLPAGYDISQQMPVAFRNNVASNLMAIDCVTGWPENPLWTYREYSTGVFGNDVPVNPDSTFQVLNNGISLIFTNVPCDNLTPPDAVSALVQAGIRIGTSGGALLIRAGGATASLGQTFGEGYYPATTHSTFPQEGLVRLDFLQRFQYKVSQPNNRSHIFVKGFTLFKEPSVLGTNKPIVLLQGSGVPPPSIGTSGDFYLDNVAYRLYGPKSGGSWGSGTSLIGPAGPGGGGNMICSGQYNGSGGGSMLPGSLNIASATKLGPGNYQFNYTTSATNTTYGAMAVAGNNGGTTVTQIVDTQLGSLRVVLTDSAGSVVDGLVYFHSFYNV